MTESLVEQVESIMRDRMNARPGGHGMDRELRVLVSGRVIQSEDGGDLLIIISNRLTFPRLHPKSSFNNVIAV
ncbi:hypothetical protein [Neorhodopirellula lusitana]|uniref:hypothetical protein n=1 Tax=Neorhodopirellula lusitana TaxID=445327 RepID=UPI00384F5561